MKSLVCEVICTVGEGLARVVDIVTESRQGVRGTQDRRHAQDRERGGGRHPRSLAHCICLSLKDLKTPRRKGNQPELSSISAGMRVLPKWSLDPIGRRRLIFADNSQFASKPERHRQSLGKNPR